MFILYGIKDYNRRNGRTVFGSCEHCKSVGFQTSCDVTSYFHIYWIPIIPVGRYRIIEHCPRCKQGKKIGKRDIEKYKKTAADLHKEAINHPGNAEPLTNALLAAVNAENYTHFHQLASAAKQHHPANLDLLDKVAAGYAYFCRFDESQDVLLKILAQSNEDAYLQTANTHSQAALLKKPKPPGGLAEKIPVLLVPTGAAVAASVVVMGALVSKPDNIYILNGLPEAYTVYVNQELVSLPAGEPFKPTVNFGKNTISPDPSGPVFFEDIALDIEGSFLSRSKGGPKITVNPDAVAVVEEISFSYVVDRNKDFAEDRSVYHTNKHLMQWDKRIHFFFEEIPEEQNVPSGSNYITRSATYQVAYPTAQIQTSVVDDLINKEAAIRYARKVAEYWPDDDDYLSNALNWGSPEENLAWLSSHLNAVPLRLEWHRHYQELASGRIDSENVREYYRKLLENDPKNPSLAYLYGRLQSNIFEAERLYQLSIQCEKPCLQGYYALGLTAAARADFGQALAYLDKTLESKKRYDLELMRPLLLGYLNDWASVKAYCDSRIFEDYLNFDYVPHYFAALGALNLRSEAEAMLAKVRADYLEYTEPEDFELEFAYAEGYAECHYAAGGQNKAAFSKAVARMIEPINNQWLYMANGRLPEACVRLEEIEKRGQATTIQDWLALYFLAAKKQNADIADKSLRRCVALLENGWRGEREVARMLVGDLPVSVHTAESLQLSFAEKGLILAALATRADNGEREKLMAAAKPFLAYPTIQHFLVTHY